MNRHRFPKWVMAGVAGVGVVSVMAGSVAFAQRNGYRPNRADRFRDRAASPSASWSEIDRQPKFDTGSRPGFYVWRNRDDVYVVANDRNRTRPSRFSGEVTVQEGTISRLSGYQTEREDRFSQVSQNRVRFSFETDNGLDGIRFHVNGGRRIVLNLNAEGGNSSDRVYLGQYKIQARQDPLVIAK